MSRHPLVPPGRWPALLLVLALAATGCTSDPDPGAEPGESPAASPTPAPDPSASPGAAACALLGRSEVAELGGRDLGPGQPTAVDSAGGLPVCEWGSMSHRGVQVAAVPAEIWARGLPEAVAALDQRLSASDAETARRLRQAAGLVAAGEPVDAAQACRLFSRLVEVGGAGAGQDRALTVVPDAEEPRAVSGQTCRQGRYVSVLVVRPDLSAATAEPVARGVEAIRERVLSRMAG